MAGGMGVKAPSKAGVKSVATPGERPSFVLGSRPPNLRQTPIQRIKPMAGQTQYGKANPGGASAGDTGQTPWS